LFSYVVFVEISLIYTLLLFKSYPFEWGLTRGVSYRKLHKNYPTMWRNKKPRYCGALA